MARPMRRVNGTGAIVKVAGKKRRKPYQVMVTLGWTDEGKQIRKSLVYYKTVDQATIALANYNENPYDISGGNSSQKRWSLANAIFTKPATPVKQCSRSPKCLNRR